MVCNGLVMQSDTVHSSTVNDDSIVNDKGETLLFSLPTTLDRGAVASGKAAIALVVEHWNSKFGLVSVNQIGPSRSGRLRRRLQDPEFAAHWREAIDRVGASEFCRGKNDRGWRADFDWFLKPETHEKIMAGRYDKNCKNKTDFDPKTENYTIAKSPF